MKNSIVLLTIFLINHVWAKALKTLPFYMTVPFTSYHDQGNLPISEKNKIAIIHARGLEDLEIGLRSIIIKDDYLLNNNSATQTNSSIVSKKRQLRAEKFQELFDQGVLQTGDIILSFRTNWADTLPYPHIQMGISHTGIVFEENGKVRNLDMPLDAEYNGQNINSAINSNHYLETDSVHIVRPKNLTMAQKQNLNSWVKELKRNYSNIRNRGLLKFNTNYLAPNYNVYGPGHSFVSTLGKILNGTDRTSTDLKMYCSEFVWSLLALSSCSTNDIKNENTNCIRPIFDPMPMMDTHEQIGMTSGPMRILDNLNLSNPEKLKLMQEVFVETEAVGLSAGHRAVSNTPEIKMLINILKGYFMASLSGIENLDMMGQMIPTVQVPYAINQQAGEQSLNYTTSSYLIHALGDYESRSFDYITTVMFVDGKSFDEY